MKTRSRKGTVEHFAKLSADELAKHGMLASGGAAVLVLSEPINGYSELQIQCVDPGRLHVSLGYPSSSDTAVQYDVSVSWKPDPICGARPYMVCPICVLLNS